VVDSLHNGSQAVLWSGTEENAKELIANTITSKQQAQRCSCAGPDDGPDSKSHTNVMHLMKQLFEHQYC